MLCDRCQKKDAKILYTEIINNAKKEQHLCEECATDYTSFQMEKPLLNSDLTLNDLLSTLLEAYNNGAVKEQGKLKAAVVCNNCHTSFEEFLNRGRFGCSECYQTFHKQLGRTLKGIQGAELHAGKRPKGYLSQMDRILKDMSETDRLSLKLQDAVEKEEFEEAARLRDLIRTMKKEETKNA